ncbi:MAG: chromate resistance protein [Proteobacteria bacterium]|nr:chromate resistance protein [Pseudomonadota bacterium]
MATPSTTITANELIRRIGTPFAPLIFDVRRAETFAAADRVIAGARWRDHGTAAQWGPALTPRSNIVVYCVHGHQISQSAAASLRGNGLNAQYLEGGIEGYLANGGMTVLRKELPHALHDTPSRWVTRERPKIDRLACPWFIRRFLDPEAEIIYVEPDWVNAVADILNGEPFDIDGVTFGHQGERCSFNTFLDHFGVQDENLLHLARVIQGADTARLDLEPQCAGLLAIALGISALHDDDHAALEQGIALYDALYAWSRHARGETHDWPGTKVS